MVISHGSLEASIIVVLLAFVSEDYKDDYENEDGDERAQGADDDDDDVVLGVVLVGRLLRLRVRVVV